MLSEGRKRTVAGYPRGRECLRRRLEGDGELANLFFTGAALCDGFLKEHIYWM